MRFGGPIGINDVGDTTPLILQTPGSAQAGQIGEQLLTAEVSTTSFNLKHQ
jgi:hypothetical protein